MASADLVDDMGDTYAAADATMLGWDQAPSSIQTGRVAGGCQRWTSRVGLRAVPSSASRTTRFAWRPASAAANSDVFRYYETGTDHIRLNYNGDGTFTVSRAGTALSGGTTANLGIASNTWYHIELYALINDTTGAFELRVNGVTVASGSGLDTRNGGTSGVVSVIRFNGRGTNDDYDDLWSDGSAGAFNGDMRVCSNLPNSDGGASQWTPSTGTAHYACVDDATPGGDTDYVSDATAGRIDTYGYPSVGVGSGATVLGVMVRLIARKDDAGTRTIDQVVRRGGTNYATGTAKTLSTSYAAAEGIFNTDPSTGSAWASVAAVNAGEYGVKEVA